MMEWEPVYKVALGGFLIGIIFGAVANKTNFCTMGAISDWVNMGDKNRLRAWLLAIGIAVLATQGMQATGIIHLNESIYLTTNFGWLGYILGGFIFGIGMTLASGCGQKTLVRIGGGNLKSLVVMLFFGFSAYMTMRGILALVRVDVIEVTNINLSSLGYADQGIDTILATVANIDNKAPLTAAVSALIGGGMIIYAFISVTFRRSWNNILAGVVIGLIIPAGWYVTGVLGFDDFEPLRLESFTFIAPTAQTVQYLMTYTGSTIDFGVAAVFGVILGSFIYAIFTGKFNIETFTQKSDMVRHIIGALMMGFGGVIALGCTIGQGLTGLSTLALGSLISLLAIVFGSALTMKIDYYLLDEGGFLSALRSALTDMKIRLPS